MPYFKADGSPLEHKLILQTMMEWTTLSTLDGPEFLLVEHLRDAAAEGPDEFETFVKAIPHTFIPILWIAILKARAHGIGRYA